MKSIDHTGQQFGRLTVLERLTQGNGHNGGEWKCVCTCGKTKVVKGMNLAAGSTSSCGCLRTELHRNRLKQRRKYHLTTINGEYYSHCKSAKLRGLSPLTRQEWESIVFAPCAYCGLIDKRNYTNKSAAMAHVYQQYSDSEIQKYEVAMNGVDRIDSLQNYSLANSAPCCGRCNWMKGSLSKDIFLNKIHTIYHYMMSLRLPSHLDTPVLNKWQQQVIAAAFRNHRSPRGIEGVLPKEQWREMIFQPCHYCGEKDVRFINRKKFTRDIDKKVMLSRVRINGIDRLDSSLGYNPANSVPCCSSCNWMKNAMPIEVFVSHVNHIYQHLSMPDQITIAHVDNVPMATEAK